MQKITVMKIGGNVVDNPTALSQFLGEFSKIEGAKVLVHGGGKIATTISKALGIEAQMIGGRRVTNEETLDVVTQVYAGLINKKITAALRSEGVNSFGLCGADGAAIVSRRRDSVPIDFGYVGDPLVAKFNVALFEQLLSSGYTPVVAPITISLDNELLNTNADTVAQTVAVGLSSVFEVDLVFCFEKKGVLLSIEDENSVIEHITPADFETLKSENIVADGMLPKLENAFAALNSGVKKVVIRSSQELLNGIGTAITL
ncbi:MAG: acetylglutamate kinase [Rikenellaceae bacterium]